MFSIEKNTSKLCLLFLISILIYYHFDLLDSQFINSHLLQFGAHEISNENYEIKLKKAVDGYSKFPETFDYNKSLSILHSLSHKS